MCSIKLCLLFFYYNGQIPLQAFNGQLYFIFRNQYKIGVKRAQIVDGNSCIC